MRLHPGDTFRVEKVEYPDQDFNAVITYGRGWAFPATKAWFDANPVKEGDFIRMGEDGHWRVLTTK